MKDMEAAKHQDMENIFAKIDEEGDAIKGTIQFFQWVFEIFQDADDFKILRLTFITSDFKILSSLNANIFIFWWNNRLEFFPADWDAGVTGDDHRDVWKQI